MTEPVLVIMAAGMGSRYGGGGLKQVDPIDDDGCVIMDFSIFDAIRAGFKRVAFIIKEEMLESFKAAIGDRIAKHMEVTYCFQRLTDIPEGETIPEGREKPWGTGHAVLSCLGKVDAPFAVIGADDYFGPSAFKEIYNFLINAKDDEKYRYAMVGYELNNTLSENGHVARGICSVDENGYLTNVTERTRIERRADGPAYTEDDGATWVSLPGNSVVSMNVWGFTPGFLKELGAKYAAFFQNDLPKNPLKGEFFLPAAVNELLQEGKATAKVLHSADRWYGVTYHEDKATVVAAIKDMKAKGIYPEHLWKEN